MSKILHHVLGCHGQHVLLSQPAVCRFFAQLCFFVSCWFMQLLTIPTMLTLARVAAIPALIAGKHDTA